MKSFLLITCCLFFFTLFNISAENPAFSDGNNNLPTESKRQRSSSSVAGGLLILVSIGIGYGTRKIYEFRSKNQEEIH